MALSPRVWFITGASTGFGRALLELVLTKGESAIATIRNPTSLAPLTTHYPPSQLLPLQLDVTHGPEAIRAAFAQAHDAFGRVDVVFNNAGYGILGEVEGTPEENARKMFDTNFWGAVNVSREAVRVFRDVNPKGVGGRLVVTSSMSALNPMPVCGFYSASKAAIDSVTQILATELDPEWNIKVRFLCAMITMFEAGSFETNGRSNSDILPQHPAYAKPTLISSVIRESMKNPPGRRGNPQKAAERLYELAGLEDPPMRLVLGSDAIRRTRQQSAAVAVEVDKFEAWSDGLGFDA
ncbi:hypothetical protein EIP91_008854 [Steccherinum ochraceum]|uniref:NAD(P)-binding protein n=1 Tax=Steccherinum ochraceum TaxID=92696 RepID=A0A4R0S3T3_9APHY|nr:hypothetical protein EIP91_008854 [Steccherinum ochraceum]